MIQAKWGHYVSENLTPGIDAKKRSGCGMGCLIFVIAAVAIVGLSTFAASSNKDDAYDPNNQYEAIAQCEARIKEQLKSPSTAKFDSTATGAGTWTVTGTVDSENGFGAMLRSDYQCSVRVNGPDSISTRIDYLR